MTIPMPKPVASTVAGTRMMQDRDGASFCLTTIIHSPAFMPDPGTKLITTAQAEAYAAAKVRESQQWQPIETAPQDGTPVLLFARLESAEASTRVVGSFILGEWLAQSYIGQNKAVLVPSHWMPLPPFPPLPGPVEPTT